MTNAAPRLFDADQECLAAREYHGGAFDSPPGLTLPLTDDYDVVQEHHGPAEERHHGALNDGNRV
jgi:hypothetical protein